MDEVFVFQMGRKDVLEGWEVGLKSACVGQMRMISFPSSMGFGEDELDIEGRAVLPPNTSLHYEIKVVKVEKSEVSVSWTQSGKVWLQSDSSHCSSLQLPQAMVEVDEEVQAKIDAVDRASEYKHKVNSPRTPKHREGYMKRSNHELSRKGLASHRERAADRKLRQEVMRRRMGAGGGDDL